ncbi:MAG: rRNA pseudouridine synthase [Bacteroidales bacterium]|nr:rRNA pseudouridine synthase [Bacteroidales bacterium]
MTRERGNHGWNRNDNRTDNRRDDRYSRDRRTFNDENDSFDNNERRPRQGESRFHKGRGKSDRFEKRFDRNNNGKRFNSQEEERPQRRRRAFEEYKRENDPRKRPRIKYDDQGGRIFSDKKKTAPNQLQPKKEDKAVRLNKYIANAGICSRREADVLITTGVIKVNGEVVTTLGYKVQPGDVVKYNGRTLKDERKIYILLNKPKGYITTSDDPQQRKTVMELIDGACRERVYPVGRLDRMTTGLLLLTNDGEMTKKLTHPSYGAQKVYNAELDRPLLKEDIDKLLEGVELEDGEMKADDVNWLNNVPIDKKKVGISIHSGKNRIIRRLFEALGYEVKKLDRVYFAGLTKKNLLRGQYRFLDDKEIGFLHMQK